MRQALAALCLLACSACFAAPPEVPTAIPAQPGEIVEVVVKVPDGVEIGYRLTGGKALFRELKAVTPGERVFWFTSKAGGTYEIVWWTKGEVASSSTVIPVAAPTPPAPPTPDPVPEPSEFAKHIVQVYAGEVAATRKDYVTKLASVYRAAAKTTALDPTVKTWKDLTDDMTKASRGMVPADAIPAVRKVIGLRLDISIGADLTKPIDRDFATKELTAVADALTAAAK